MPKIVIQNSRADEVRDAYLTVPGLDEAGDVDLVVIPFECDGDTNIPGLTAATFPGYTSLTSSTPELIRDAESGKWWIYFPEPAGGWVFTRTAGAGDPQTVYGFRVGGIGCALIAPRVIAAAGDSVVIGDIYLPVADIAAIVG